MHARYLNPSPRAARGENLLSKATSWPCARSCALSISVELLKGPRASSGPSSKGLVSGLWANQDVSTRDVILPPLLETDSLSSGVESHVSLSNASASPLSWPSWPFGSTKSRPGAMAKEGLMVDQKKHTKVELLRQSHLRIKSSRINWTQHLCFVESSDAPAWSVGDARI